MKPLTKQDYLRGDQRERAGRLLRSQNLFVSVGALTATDKTLADKYFWLSRKWAKALARRKGRSITEGILTKAES